MRGVVIPITALVLVAASGCGGGAPPVASDVGFPRGPVDAGVADASAAAPDGGGSGIDVGGGDASPVALPPEPLPQYDVALPQDVVSRIDISVAASDWAAMQADLTSMLGPFGAGGLALPVRELTYLPREPLFVPATVAFGGQSWQQVGIRYRGNATLAQGWRSGKRKLSFSLDFDQFENVFPTAKNQRFFGIKTLALLNNGGDPSLLREKVAGDLYRLGGVPAARSAFYRVYVDFGSGPTYFGLYTAAEVPGKPMLRAQLGGNDSGNLYKPDGNGAQFVTFDQTSFEKKTNETTSSWVDVQAVFGALHATRTPAAPWRAGLDKVWDTNGFLRWLAVNTVIQNWDSYGVFAHNFYLYGVPAEGGRLHWIPWDNNESFKPGLFIWTARSLTMTEVAADWPLIRFLMDDPVYRPIYFGHMKTFVNGPFKADAVIARFRKEHQLIAPHVLGPMGETPDYTQLARPADFTAELTKITDRVQAQYNEALRVLSQNP